MEKSKGGRRRHLVDMATPPEPDVSPTWVYEPEEHDEELRYEVPLGEGEGLIYRQVYRQGRLVDFNISQCTRSRGRWVLVARADSCHGTVHLHQYTQAGTKVGEPEVLRAIVTQQDLEDGYDLADGMLETTWQDNLRRWTDGR